MNVLEELVSEWYEYQGYFVRRDIKVGKRATGGYEGELDIVAFHPVSRKIVHIETSMGAESWEKRRSIFQKKFSLGEKYIPMLFPFVESKPDKVAVLGFPRSTRLKDPLGPDIKVMFIPDLMKKITIKFSKIKVEEKAIPETYPLLRTIQFALDYGGYLKSK